jgi:hypothetical protein
MAYAITKHLVQTSVASCPPKKRKKRERENALKQTGFVAHVSNSSTQEDWEFEAQLRAHLKKKAKIQETHLTDRNKHRLKMKGWKKIYQAHGP